MGVNNVTAEMLKKRFNRAVLLDLAGDMSSLEGPGCEVVDVYRCQHLDILCTIVHIPGGTLPDGVQVIAAMPMDYSF